jgi:hypothetical protein
LFMIFLSVEERTSIAPPGWPSLTPYRTPHIPANPSP